MPMIQEKVGAQLIFQDIRRAFDSVDPVYLLKAVHRIKIPIELIKMLTFIAENRVSNVITEYGETDQITIQRGVEQVYTLRPDPYICT